jgi:dipeptidyl aminopeptidase/acylaminoacyl peptidase
MRRDAASTLMKPSKTSHRRAVKPEDLNRFRIVSDPQISPDGSLVVFVEKRVATPNDYQTNLWLAETTERARGTRPPAPLCRQVTEGGSDRMPRWSPDGSRIAFVRSDDEDQSQIYTIAREKRAIRSFAGRRPGATFEQRSGGFAQKDRPVFPALKLTSFPEGTIGNFLWSPNGKWLAASFRHAEAERTLREKKSRAQQGMSELPWVIDDIYYRLDGDGYFIRRHYALYLIEVASGTHQLLYDKHTGGDFTFDFSPDSRQLVVATTRAKTPTLEPWKDELLRIDLRPWQHGHRTLPCGQVRVRSRGTITRIPGLPPGPKLAVCWSPDGKTIAYAGRIGKDPAYSTENLELFVCDAIRGNPRSLTGEHDLCLQSEGITDSGPGFGDPNLQFGKNGSRIYMRLGVRGDSHVLSVPVHGGPQRGYGGRVPQGPLFHTRGSLDVRMGNLSKDGRKMALTVGKATRLAEVAVLDCEPLAAAVGCRQKKTSANGPTPSALWASKPKILTKLNAPLLAELKIVKPRSYWIKAADGHRVQLWVMRPPEAGRSRQRPMPALLQIHGGPHAGYCSSFFHEFQVLASAGYTVFYSNPRGSKGYGRDHCAAIRGRWGTDDWTDLQAVIRFMQQQPDVDRRRMGVIGGSYGGYMTNWIISHSNDFAAAVTDRCISNLVSWSGNTDVVEQVDYYHPGNFWDQADARWDRSPMKYLSNVKTPTLIIHSEGDLRCNIEQAEQLYSALKVMGVPARFVRYPSSTSHGMSRNGPPDLRIHRLQQILAWWKKYLT